MATTPILGIDFGTTNTKAAWIDRQGKLHVVPVDEKRHVLPSVVWFKSPEKWVVGLSALQMIVDDPKNTVYAPKRFLGRAYKSHFVAHNKGRFQYEIVEGENGKAAVSIHGRVISFTDVAFRIIDRMLELARAAAGHDFEEAVLTVPAHFGYSQRQAVRTAAEMAGLEVRALVNEPTAAALYCAKRRSAEQTILVYDLGGGTFDISLVAIRGSMVLVVATGGDPFLGGNDFDHQIATRLAERFESQHGVEIQNNRAVMQRLVFACERAKIALSSRDTAEVRAPFVAMKDDKPLGINHTLTREAVETMTSNLIEKTVGASEELLKRAGLGPGDLDELIFVGGQTRMPALQRRMAAAFGTEPGKNINPELGVAVGAAILGRGLEMPTGPDLVDVVSIPVGVMLPGGETREVIPRNAGVPCVRKVAIERRPPQGSPLPVGLYEAVDPQSLDREYLGKVLVPADWLAAHPGRLSLELTMTQDFDLKVAVVDERGDALSLEIEAAV